MESKYNEIKKEEEKIKDSPPQPSSSHKSPEKADTHSEVKNDEPITYHFQPVPQQGEQDYDLSDIIRMFEGKEVKLIEPILHLMNKKHAKLTWNTKTGEIVFLDKPVPNSNIVELLKDTLVGTLHPLGKMEFLRGLDMLNVNLKFIKDPKVKRLLTVLRGDEATLSKPVDRKPSSKLKNHTSNSTNKDIVIASNDNNTKPNLSQYAYDKKPAKLKWLRLK